VEAASHPIATEFPTGRTATVETLREAAERLVAELRAALPPTEAPAARPEPGDDDISDLSNRERDVLELVADGLTNEEIAPRLYLSVRTVERHLSNIYVKLRVSGKAARAAAAARYSRFAVGSV
jgi:DNA-binding NarL/FixJ family response regulator